MKKAVAVALSAVFLSAGVAAANEPGVFYSDGPKDRKMIALTFDDGPGPWTERVLGALKDNGVRATFFMEGDLVEFRQPIARKVREAGHEIGSHLYSHPNLYAYMKTHADYREKLTGELDKTEKLIEQATGVRPYLVRCPNGFSKPWARGVAREKGYVMVNWTFGCDWSRMTGPQMAEAYKKHLAPGAIFLMHDGGKDRSRTLEALTALITEAKNQGYAMVTVSELLGLHDQVVAQGEKVKKIRFKAGKER